jgi:hypothetical protein
MAVPVTIPLFKCSSKERQGYAKRSVFRELQQVTKECISFISMSFTSNFINNLLLLVQKNTTKLIGTCPLKCSKMKWIVFHCLTLYSMWSI